MPRLFEDRDIVIAICLSYHSGPMLALLIHTLSGSNGTLAAAIFLRQVLNARVHLKCLTTTFYFGFVPIKPCTIHIFSMSVFN